MEHTGMASSRIALDEWVAPCGTARVRMRLILTLYREGTGVGSCMPKGAAAIVCSRRRQVKRQGAVRRVRVVMSVLWASGDTRVNGSRVVRDYPRWVDCLEPWTAACRAYGALGRVQHATYKLVKVSGMECRRFAQRSMSRLLEFEFLVKQSSGQTRIENLSNSNRGVPEWGVHCSYE